jgi:hypothetical protein
MLTSDQITELFFLVDEYCILFEKNINESFIKVYSSLTKGQQTDLPVYQKAK